MVSWTDFLNLLMTNPSRAFHHFMLQFIDSGMEVVVLMIGLAIIGCNLINSLCARTTMFNHVVSFAVLFSGGVIATNLMAPYIIPLVDSKLVMAAITANLGMTLAGIVLILIYRRSPV